jgi:adenylosuccinate lyase
MGAHLVDSTVYGHLWATPELHELFDDRGRFQSWLDILVALAEAQAEVGLVPADAARAIRLHASVERLDLSRVAEETRATGHSTLGLIHCLQEVLPEDAAEWVYFGATVQDLSDTWNALVMRRVGDVLERDLRRAEGAALTLAERHRDTILCGRTHGQPGLPVTFGFKAAVWASELRRHRERVAEGRRRWEVVQLGGALGTMEFWGDRALPLLDGFARRLGLAAPDIAWITARDRIAEFHGLLAMVTATLAKIGNEIYELQRPEIGEVSEPFTPGQVGSITMPHKRNPELSEHLGTLARVVRADAGVAVEAMVHEHERDGRAWKAEWVVFPEACLLTGVSLAVAARLLEGLEVHPERMAANLEARGGYVLSEPVLRTLADRMGKHAAHQALYDATMAGLQRGVDLAEALLADPAITKHLDEAELSQCLDPRRALGAAPAFVDRVLAAASDEEP